VLEQLGDPLAISDVCFASRHSFDVLRVYQHQVEAVFQ
jgi:hypothetical protein